MLVRRLGFKEGSHVKFLKGCTISININQFPAFCLNYKKYTKYSGGYRQVRYICGTIES